MIHDLRRRIFDDARSRATFFVIGTLAASLSLATEARAVQVTTAHPRLFATTGDLPLLRARVGITDGNNQSTYASQWNSHASEYQELRQSAAGASWTGSDNRGTRYYGDISSNAFVYLLSGDTSFADRALSIWTQFINDGGSGISENHYGHSTGYFYAAAFDWLFPYMSASQRQEIGQWLWGVVQQMEANGFLDPDDADNSDHGYHGSYHASAVLVSLLALYDSGVQSNSVLQERIDFYIRHKELDYLDHYNAYGFGSFGGYAQYIFVADVLGAWAAQSATDYDLMNATIVGPNGNAHMTQYFAGVGRWVMASHRSDMTESEQPGDGYFSEFNKAASEGRTLFIPYKFVQEYGDTYLKWFLENPYADKFDGGNGGISFMFMILSNDKSIAANPNATPSLVQNNCDNTQGGFGCGGHHVIRASWDFNAPDYAHVIVTAGHAHQHWRLASHGSYDITYGSWMFTGQTAAYDNTASVYFEQYYRRSWAFNTVDVGNVGFDRGSVPLVSDVTTIDRPNDQYLALAADVTSTLSNPTNSGNAVISLFEREWALVDERYVVVFDRVIALDANDQKVINIHSYDKEVPVVLDGDWDGGAQQNNFGGTPGTTSSAGTRFAINGINPLDPLAVGPRLITSVVSPQGYTLRLVGGPNSQNIWNTGDPGLRNGTATSKFGTTESLYPDNSSDLSGRLGQDDISFEGYNRDTQRNYPFNLNGFDSEMERAGNTGRWRVEVAVDTGHAEDVVVTVHEIVDSQLGDGAAVVPIFSVEQRSGGLPQFVGATLGDSDGHVVMYNTASQAATSVTYETQSSVLPLHHRIRGMQAGSYAVFLDGQPELIVDAAVEDEFIAFDGVARRVEIRPLWNAQLSPRVK